MPFEDGEFIKSDRSVKQQALATRLDDQFERSVDTTPNSVFTSIIKAWTDYEHEYTEETIQTVYEQSFLESATDENLDRVVGDYGIERHDSIKATGVVTFSRSNPAGSTYSIQSGTRVQTGGDTPIVYETTEYVELGVGETSVSADIQAIEGGVSGNVAAGSIENAPSWPQGVSKVDNAKPIGDPEYTDTDGEELVAGQPEESDAELRERAKEIITGGGSATVDAILGAILNGDNVAAVESVMLFNNRGTSTDEHGLPPKSFELIVYGGDADAIAETLFENVSVCDRMVNGINGTAVSRTVTSDQNGQEFTILFSRPTEKKVDFDITLVKDESYIGDTEIRDRIVEYVGGTTSTGDIRLGRDIGAEVYIDELTDIIVGEDTGVIGISSLSTTPSTTTDEYGLEVVDVSSTEVARTDATDGSITITQKNF